MSQSERFEWPGRRVGDAAHDQLAAFLRMDIQRDLEWAADLCAEIEAVSAGRAPSWQRVGNAYCLRITREAAELEDVIDDDAPVTRLPLAELRAAAEAWRAMLT